MSKITWIAVSNARILMADGREIALGPTVMGIAPPDEHRFAESVLGSTHLFTPEGLRAAGPGFEVRLPGMEWEG